MSIPSQTPPVNPTGSGGQPTENPPSPGKAKLPTGQAVTKAGEAVPSAIEKLQKDQPSPPQATPNTTPLASNVDGSHVDSVARPIIEEPPLLSKVMFSFGSEENQKTLAATFAPSGEPSPSPPKLVAQSSGDGKENTALQFETAAELLIEQFSSLHEQESHMRKQMPANPNYEDIKGSLDFHNDIIDQMNALCEIWERTKKAPSFVINATLKELDQRIHNLSEAKGRLQTNMSQFIDAFIKAHAIYMEERCTNFFQCIDKQLDELGASVEYNPKREALDNLLILSDKVTKMLGEWNKIKALQSTPAAIQCDQSITKLVNSNISLHELIKYVNDYESFLKDDFVFLRITKGFKHLDASDLALLARIPNLLWLEYETWVNAAVLDPETEPAIPAKLLQAFKDALADGRNLDDPQEKAWYESDRRNLGYILRQVIAVNAYRLSKENEKADNVD